MDRPRPVFFSKKKMGGGAALCLATKVGRPRGTKSPRPSDRSAGKSDPRPETRNVSALCPEGKKKNAPVPLPMGREHRILYTSWCHPLSPRRLFAKRAQPSWPRCVRGAGRGVSARARGLSSPVPPAPLPAKGRCSLYGGRAGYSCPVMAPSILYCMCFSEKCQARRPVFAERRRQCV